MASRWWTCLLLAALFGCTAPDDGIAPDPSDAIPENVQSSSTSSTSPTTSSASTTTVAVVTTSTTSPTTTITRLPTSDLTGFVIRADGLGVVSFGDPMDDVIAILTGALGEPSSDIVMEAPFDSGYEGIDRGPMACNTATGYACFEYLRWMSWKETGLGVTFLDVREDPGAEAGEDDYYPQAPPNLQAYSYWGGEADGLFATIRGVTVGTTVEELQKLGDDVRFSSDACGGVIAFGIVDPTASNGIVWGWLDAQSGEWERFEESGALNPGATVASLGAGARSSC